MSQRLTDGLDDVPLPGLTVGEVRKSIEESLGQIVGVKTLADVAAHHLCGLASKRADQRFDFGTHATFLFRMEVAAGVAPKRKGADLIDLIRASDRLCNLLGRGTDTTLVVNIPAVLEAVAALRAAIAEAR